LVRTLGAGLFFFLSRRRGFFLCRALMTDEQKDAILFSNGRDLLMIALLTAFSALN